MEVLRKTTRKWWAYLLFGVAAAATMAFYWQFDTGEDPGPVSVGLPLASGIAGLCTVWGLVLALPDRFARARRLLFWYAVIVSPLVVWMIVAMTVTLSRSQT